MQCCIICFCFVLLYFLSSFLPNGPPELLCIDGSDEDEESEIKDSCCLDADDIQGPPILRNGWVISNKSKIKQFLFYF